jgi:hypothetical protein
LTWVPLVTVTFIRAVPAAPGSTVTVPLSVTYSPVPETSWYDAPQ